MLRYSTILVSVLAITAACGGGERARTDTGAAAAPSTPDTGAAAAPATPGTTAAADGATLFQRCATCHQLNGQGLPGTYPPLAGSEFINAPNPAAAIRVILHGIQGPITVHGQTYNSVMPAYGTGVPMSDAEVAAVLTYERSNWGNKASAVTAEMVAKERAATASQTGMWTAEQLQSLLK